MMEIMGGQIRGHYSVFRICRDSLSCIRTLRHGGCLPLDGGLNLAEGPLGWQCPTHVSPCCVCTVSHFIQESFLVEQLQKGSSASCSLLHLSVSSALQHSIVINHRRKNRGDHLNFRLCGLIIYIMCESVCCTLSGALEHFAKYSSEY